MEILEVADRTPDLINQLLEVWENSVRATHLFLSEKEIKSIREYVPQALREIAHLMIAEDEAGCGRSLYGHRGRYAGNAVHCLKRERKRAGETPDPIRNGKLWN